MGLIEETLGALAAGRKKYGDHCVVAFSGGKDSLVCLDLAVRAFGRVDAFNCEFIPGLECVDEVIHAAEHRWSIKIRRYPHWGIRDALQNGLYCFNGLWSDRLVRWEMSDVFALARHDTGARVLVHGAKKADSVWRRRTLAVSNRDHRLYPIESWGKRDVFAFLHSRKIPMPTRAAGIDLSHSMVLWLHDEHPADFRRLCEFFPLAEALIWKRKFYPQTFEGVS